MKNLPLRLNMQYFADDSILESTPEQIEQTKINYADLLKTDKDFQSFVDKERTLASQTASSNTEKKIRALYDNQMSEKDKLSIMSAEDKAIYWQKKAEDNESKTEQYRQSEQLKSETSKMFIESKIPTELISIFNFESITAEQIKANTDLLSKYEFYPKGEFERSVMLAVAEKLKQPPPENHSNHTVATKQQYTAMTIDQRIKLKQENPQLYEKLKGE